MTGKQGTFAYRKGPLQINGKEGAKKMDFARFKRIIRAIGGVWATDNVYFDCTQSMYTASYLPTYPEKSPEDSRISCCWVSGMWYYSGEYTKKTNSFEV